MSDSKSTSSGIGFCGLLTIAFIVLKLCNVINWSWLWVLSPLWIPIAITIVVVVLEKRFKKKDKERRNLLNEPLKRTWQQRLDEMKKQQEMNKLR